MKFKSKFILIIFLVASFFSTSCSEKSDKINDQFSFAQSRKSDLQLSIYITAQAINNLLATESGRREAISIFRCNGITKAYVEVYRSGLIIEKSILEKVRDNFLANGIEVVGGIATVPGRNFGVKQEGQLGWFNWQNKKTQNDLKEVVRMSATVFDEFIVDDFLCTSDTSLESKQAKGSKDWSQYRRDLLTKLSSEIFIKPAKEVNPDISMIIKYPQWYDRFHLFGYELEREPELFDKVWVGTESRGQYTQRFGFVQPYEGFVNFRWIKDIVGEKIGGAWFDHGDCDENDFIEQAYQSVLAGAKEIVLFNYFDFVNEHKGHHLLRYQFQQLADLAKSIAVNPVKGIAGYKPINSDAGGDLYIMDFIGTLGIPLVPVHKYPENAEAVFLPTQAASDKNILSKVEKSIAKGATIIFTTGFLANATDGVELAKLAGLNYPIVISPLKVDKIFINNRLERIKYGLDLESKVTTSNAKVILSAGERKIPFLIESRAHSKIFTLNTHTFSQSDFDKVGEVLLCPKPLGLLEIPRLWANEVRETFTAELSYKLDAPTRIVFQPVGSAGWVIHNYNKTTETVTLTGKGLNGKEFVNGFTGESILATNNKLNLTIGDRSRIWIKIK